MKHYNNFRLFVLLCNLVSLSWCIELWKDGGLLPLKTVDAACLEPKVIGPCRAKVPRYHYNGVTEECEVFSYGGCGGNSNNFETLEQCNDKCTRAVQQEKKSICQGPPQNGPSCEAIIPRWTYNTSTEECVQFIYNGCGATTNNFPDQIDCQLQCGDISSCSLPKAVGPCFADQKHWWFDASEGECKEFVYGGCGGNSNRYRTRTECEAVCKSLVLKRKRQELESEKNSCEGVKCPGGISHYTELGCRPIHDDGACCPTRFECPERLVNGNSSQCGYRGKIYNNGDVIPAADSGLGCRASCNCNNGEISCAYVECPELFGYFPKPGCQISLHKPDQCCAYDYACGNETTVCDFEGEKYVEDHKMYPKEEPCLVCYCKPGFNGTLSSEYCKKIDCGIEIWYGNYLKRGCTPVYFQNSDGRVGCCPISWKCPGEDDAPTTEESNSGETLTATSLTPSNMTSPDTKTAVVTDPTIRVEKAAFSCTEPKAVGDCQATRIRYFYNSNSSQCEEFEYSGCGGNLNNFQSLRQCITSCTTDNTESPIFSRFKKPSITVSSAFGSSDPCTEEPRTGRCRAYFRRWFFDPKSNQCKMFIYGGCNRNENNFYTKAACEATCLKVYYDVCGAKPEDLERDCGLDNSTKFYFDAESGLCKRFTSTGCTGTNVFNRYEDCHSQCAGGSQAGPQYSPPFIPVVAQASSSFKSEDVCLLPRQAGSCIGHFPSYYYDAISKSCKSFIYGGCYGNRNRFMNFEDCKSTCEMGKQNGNNMAGGSIAFGDRPQVEDPNVVNWPVSAGKRDTTAVPPTDNNALANRAEAEAALTNPSNSIREDDSKFIFTRMIGNPAQFQLNSKPTTDSPDAEHTEVDSSSTTSPPEGREPQEKSEGLEAEEVQETQFHLTQIRRTSDEEEDTTVPQVEDSNFMRQTEFNLGQSQQDTSPEVLDDHQLPTTGSTVLGMTGIKSPRAASDPCTLDVNEGSCNQTILRFYWDGIGCRAFNFTGCGGNKNRFETEYACRRTCSDSFEELASDFYCTFGNRVIPFGESLDNTAEECGSRFCTCSVPPALTCTVKACAS